MEFYVFTSYQNRFSRLIIGLTICTLALSSITLADELLCTNCSENVCIAANSEYEESLCYDPGMELDIVYEDDFDYGDYYPNPEDTNTELGEELAAKSCTVTDFWATWCAPCVQLKPKIEALKVAYPHVNFVFEDVSDQNDPKVQEILRNNMVTSFPTIVLEKDGMELLRISGVKAKVLYPDGTIKIETTESIFQRWIDKHCKPQATNPNPNPGTGTNDTTSTEDNIDTEDTYGISTDPTSYATGEDSTDLMDYSVETEISY